MKPRLIKINGVWHCRAGGKIRTGLGYTPFQAYHDWLFLGDFIPAVTKMVY
jgi:ribosomal protein L37AE/L43A